MGPHFFLCLTFFTALLPVTASPAEIPDPVSTCRLPGCANKGTVQRRVSFVNKVGEQRPSLYDDLGTHSFHEKFLTQNKNLKQLSKTDVQVLSSERTDVLPQAGSPSSAHDSVIGRKYSHSGKRSTAGSDRLRSTDNRDIVSLTSDLYGGLSHNPSLDSRGQLKNSRVSECRKCTEDSSQVSQAVERSGQGMSLREKKERANTRRTRATLQGSATSSQSWRNERDALMSSLGIESANNLHYEGLDSLADQMTPGEREREKLFQDMTRDILVPASTEIQYSLPQELVGLNINDGNEEIADDPLALDKDVQGPDKMLLQSLEAGNEYYSDPSDASAGLSKRDNRKHQIHQWLAEGTRDSHRVSLGEQPRIVIPLRKGKVKSTQKNRPMKPKVSASKTAKICEPENDGTPPMRCPSAQNVCLYDAMICDGTPNCPKGEDETFALCVLRHWVSTTQQNITLDAEAPHELLAAMATKLSRYQKYVLECRKRFSELYKKKFMSL